MFWVGVQQEEHPSLALLRILPRVSDFIFAFHYTPYYSVRN